jgi:light-regulated signal transduction histidine kinase (bacteriophytochrome)
MIERRYGDKLDERGKQYIDFAVDGAKRMQLLINDLLSFSRVGRFSRTDGTVSSQDALGRAIDNLSHACADTSAEVVADPLPEVTGDLTLLTQLFQNLIGNAVKFRGDDPPRVRVGARFDGEMWEFFCSDNGIGIDPRYADRIFLIFQRLHPQDEYTGTGIGLAMCKKIVEYHGGRIWLDTGTGSAEVRTRSTGTTIRWTLPAAPSTVTPEAPIDGHDPAAAVTTGGRSPGPRAGGAHDSDGADPASGGSAVDTAEEAVSPAAREASDPWARPVTPAPRTGEEDG